MTSRQDGTQEQCETLEVLQGEDEILRFAQDDTQVAQDDTQAG